MATHSLIRERSEKDFLNGQEVNLRTLRDFLNACQDAMPHVKGLDILNDCEENQKLIHKLPDWVASRWNGLVTQSLNERQEFPTFEDFANFISTEDEIACNFITSFHALPSSDSSTERRNPRDLKRNMASVLTTQTVADNEKRRSDKNQNYRKAKTPCVHCQDAKQQMPSSFL